MDSITERIKGHFAEGPDSLLNDRERRVLKEHGGFVAGGALTSIACNREIADVDIYVPSLEAAIDLMQGATYAHKTSKSITFSDARRDHPCQIITMFYPKTPEEIFGAFDFSVCMAAYSFADDEVYYGDSFVADNMQRRLRFNHNTAFPISSLSRVDKYKEKGYSISNIEYMKILASIASLGIKDIDGLAKQVGGMYGDAMLIGIESLEDFYQAEDQQLVSMGVNAQPISRVEKELICDHYPQLRHKRFIQAHPDTSTDTFSVPYQETGRYKVGDEINLAHASVYDFGFNHKSGSEHHWHWSSLLELDLVLEVKGKPQNNILREGQYETSGTYRVVASYDVAEFIGKSPLEIARYLCG